MNPDESCQAIGDIFYEADMLYRTYIEFWEPRAIARKKLPQLIHNCCIEATLVHTRALLEFFERSRKDKNRPHKDDVLAEDYGFPTQLFSFSNDLRKRINLSVAHLSYARARVAAVERHWDFHAFVPPILLRASEFFRHLLGAAVTLPDGLTVERLEAFVSSVERFEPPNVSVDPRCAL
jgi:hypothetical protein